VINSKANHSEERIMTKVVPIDSKQKDATVYTMMDSEVEASLHGMYVNGKLNDEQMTLVAERFPGFRLPKAREKTSPTGRLHPLQDAAFSRSRQPTLHLIR